MNSETIVVQFQRPNTSHIIISRTIDGLAIGYGNPYGSIVKAVEWDFLPFKDAPEFREIHDGRGWNITMLTALVYALQSRSEVQA
jgi:hypothetical protein